MEHYKLDKVKFATPKKDKPGQDGRPDCPVRDRQEMIGCGVIQYFRIVISVACSLLSLLDKTDPPVSEVYVAAVISGSREVHPWLKRTKRSILKVW
jgi:hypothetical protein